MSASPPHPSRREVLQRCAAFAALAGGLDALGASPASGPHAIPEPCSSHAWRKHGVILEPTEPWETDHIQNFTSVVEPLDADRWRFWYSPCGARDSFTLAYAEGVPGRPMRKVPARLSAGRPLDTPFSIGNLPAGWRPTQVVHIHLPNDRHRIYFWAHGDGILRYLAAESDDGRRYRVLDPYRPVLYHYHDRAAGGVTSPDGLRLNPRPASRPADEPAAPPHLLSNDATNVYHLPDGTFETFSVALLSVPRDNPAYVAEDNAAGLIRVVDHLTSADGLRFENRRRVIQLDAADPPDQQFYYLAVTPTPQGRVGMLGHYRVRAQTMDLEWCFSADGRSWRRPHRTAWLPRGDETDPDSYGIYAPSSLVQRDGRWHLFYTGVNSAHNARQSLGRPRTVIMHASVDSIWAPASRPAP